MRGTVTASARLRFDRKPVLQASQPEAPINPATIAAIQRAFRARGPYDVIDVASAEGLWAGVLRRAGMLVVYVDRTLNDAGNLTYLLDATRKIAARVLAEVADAAARPAAIAAP